MTIKEEVQEIIDNVLVYDVDDAGTPFLDPNANYRRWFRCWMDGSWIGRDRVIESETVETTTLRELREIVFDDMKYLPPHPRNDGSPGPYYGGYFPTCGYWVEGSREQARWLRGITRRLRAWVIHEFTGFVAHDTGGQRGTVQRYLVDAATEEDLARLTRELIDDALGMISAGITDDPSEAELEISDTLREDISRAFTDRYVPEPLGYLATSHWRKA
jgi:hypothetical protein